MDSMPAFTLKRPTSVAEATALLAGDPQARLIAGGTDLIPNLRRGIERPPVLVDLGDVAGLDAISFTPEGTWIGAGVRLSRLAADASIGAAWPALAQAAGSIAGPGHRSVASVGGNLCLDTRCVFYNQSEWWRASNHYCLKRGGDTCHVAPQGARCHAAFSGDLAPALLVLDAEVELLSSRATRCIPLADLYRDDGAAHLTIARDEVLTRVWVPAAANGRASGYRKARARAAMDFPLAGVACSVAVGDDGSIRALRVALTGTNSHPLVLAGTDALVGQIADDETLTTLGKLVQKQVSPMRTTVTQSNYRRQVAAVLAQRLLQSLTQPADAPVA